ncbi:peptidoglycan binding domain-containing protein, partial [Candidatus Microgenomates bacterium]|nr:peptidoglycan binding domain-containing protein [Candidatus Microgenomates bacterium]
MVKRKKVLKKKQKKQSPKFQKKSFFLGLFLGILILTVAGFFLFEKKYQGRVYPGVKILGFDFGGKKTKQVKDFFEAKNYPFENLKIIFFHQDKIATISGKLIKLGFDSDLSAQQAHFIGRGGDFLSQSSMKFRALTQGIELSPLFKWRKEPLEETLDLLSQTINIEPQNALFNFEDSKVVAFRLSKKGQRLNTKKTLADLE